MKKDLSKKLVLKKFTVTSLDADKLNAVRGGRMADSIKDCTEGCGPTVNCEGGGGSGGSQMCSGLNCPWIWKTVNC